MNDSDPADVHTDTDRVELTDAEREALLFGFGIRFYENADHTRFAQGVAAVESIVAARQETNRRIHEQMKQGIETMTKVHLDRVHELTAERDAARAELAAANTRCAELENIIDREGFVEAKLRAERDALQIRLDSLAKLFAALTPEGTE